MNTTAAPFNIYVPIEKAVDSDDGLSWVLQGPLSNPDRDLERDKARQSGVWKGLDTFKRLDGPVDWNHNWERTGEPKWLIGKGLETWWAPHPKTGKRVPWLKTALLKGKEIAKQAIEHLEAGGSLGYSIAGGAIRSAADPSDVVRTYITSVAITPMPVVAENVGCLSLVKALTDDLDDELTALRALPFPLCKALQPLVDSGYYGDDFAKSLMATAGLPASGPGVNALGVENLAGRVASAEGKRRRKKRRPTQEELRKALDRSLASRLRAQMGAY